LASEARPAFLAITGHPEPETADAAARFAACLRAASGEAEQQAGVAECSALAARAFSGDKAAWAPLVRAVRQLLSGPGARTARGHRSRRELRAFVAENADLLD
jgi:hypothetical protein